MLVSGLSLLTVIFSVAAQDLSIQYVGIWSQFERATPATSPNMQGRLVTVHWKNVEPEKGLYYWDEVNLRLLDQAELNMGIGLRVYTGPDTPAWVYAEGVPEIRLNCSNPNEHSHDCWEDASFPYYPDPLYQELYFGFIREFHNHLETLPSIVRDKIIFIQAMYGSTGDVTPWHGYPICPDSLPDCYIDDNSEEFLEYVRFTNLVFYTEYQPTQPRIHLILNGGGALDDWNWENIPEHWLKRGMASHGYQLNAERETEEEYMAQARGDVDGYQIRIRGENSDDTTEDGWWQEAIPWNTMAHMAWLANFGLDFHEINEPYISSPMLQPAFQFFNRQVTNKRLEYASGGFCYMRQELDSSDTVLFPEEVFGKAKQSNADRMVAIAESFASQGARQEDPGHGTGIPMNNRDAKALNDVGWDIHRGNYESNIYQLDPEGTSKGMWRVGNGTQELFGRFARRFDQESDLHTMRFQLNRSLWEGLPISQEKELVVRLAYFDSGVGVFQVKYDGQMRIDEDEHSLACDFHCMRVEKNNSGLWQVAEWRISDAAFGQGGPYHADIWIQSVDDEDDIFGMLEVFDPSVAFNTPLQRFRNYFPVSSTYVNVHQEDENQSSEPALYVKHDNKISYLRFASIQPDCEVDQVFLKLWMTGDHNEETTITMHKTVTEWEEETVTWNSRPELSEAVASFDNLPAEFQLFVNIDITDVFLADPDLITGFALTASEDTTGQIKFKEQRDPSGKTTRLVVKCKK